MQEMAFFIPINQFLIIINPLLPECAVKPLALALGIYSADLDII
jgi:hypothetical protein